MEKTELMSKIEEEAELTATIQTGTCGELPRWWYVLELERRLEKAQVKAEAYDRLMSGGKKTLKEFANFLQRPIAIQPSRSGCVAIFANVPFLGETEWRGYWMSTIACDFDYTGDWKDSLTLPDGLEEK